MDELIGREAARTICVFVPAEFRISDRARGHVEIAVLIDVDNGDSTRQGNGSVGDGDLAGGKTTQSVIDAG